MCLGFAQELKKRRPSKNILVAEEKLPCALHAHKFFNHARLDSNFIRGLSSTVRILNMFDEGAGKEK